ncbi:N-acetylglucosamine kinase [Altibacter lentus]|uniref:N-acetylglucosamine kinase n=1 Tax=Altibacter lentus TaxID=1223410 RepID=UPI000555CCC0|nr:N-acetylglucosamine kinase [Altibacter lentus]
MILFTDGGSTKCDWILMDHSGDVLLKTQTPGLNPAVVPQEEIERRILSNNALQSVVEKVTILDFYGAGCSTKTPVAMLQATLSRIFTQATISVQEDMVAAVHAVTTTPGIVCILGTGSNSCYFDGTTLRTVAPSLGYSVMDEASGNYFGKQLLRDYFYGRMPAETASEFAARFDLEPDTIKLNLYKRTNANAYLASFAEFIFTSEAINDYFYQLIRKGVDEFIACRVLPFSEAKKVPIHFMGSIAHFSEKILRDSCKEHGLQLGKVLQRPIDGLIDYYRTHRIQNGNTTKKH